MHPDIKKFWETKNTINRQGDRSPEYYTWYIRVNKDPFGQIIAHEWKDGSKTEYFFNNKTYTESQMLRLVGLKAFL